MRAFVKCKFGYCPLVWMFCSRQENTLTNHLHERALRIVYNDNESTFENLLELNNSVQIIRHTNIRLLSIELFPSKHLVVFKKSSRQFLKRSSRRLRNKQKVYWGYLSLTNLNVYLTNQYLTNLYLTNLRRIQNVLIRIQ